MNQLFLYFLCFLSQQCNSLKIDDDKFLYYAYGSNLLSRRLLINNPTAKFFSIAKLSGYRLDFNMYLPLWRGAVATIVKDVESNVWGTLWKLRKSDIQSLDKQEGVEKGWYYAKNVSVTTPEGYVMTARVYQETVDPPKIPSNELPPERQPSDTYMQIIIYGAIESYLPMHYLRFLFTFPTNGQLASYELRQQLGYPFNVTDPQ